MITATLDGKRVTVADRVNFYLTATTAPPPSRFNASLGRMEKEELDQYRGSMKSIPIDTNHAHASALTDAARCMQCDCGKKESCQLREAAHNAGIEKQPVPISRRRSVERHSFPQGLVYEPGKCILCGRCVGLTADMQSGLSFQGRGLNVRVAPPFTVHFDTAMGDRLKACVAACPTGALWIRNEPEGR